MPTIVNRDDTVALLRATWHAIDELYTGLDDVDYATPTCLPGWTVQDQLSHLTGTEEMLLGRPAPSPDIGHLTHLRNDIAKMNEAWVEDKRRLSGPEVLEQFRAATAARLEALDAMDPAALDARIDVSAETRALMQPDGIHSGVDAQPRILDNVWQALEPLLDGATERRQVSAGTAGPTG